MGRTATRARAARGRASAAPNRKGAAHAAIGVDTGGTFTDLALSENGRVRVEKLSSTPSDPSRAVLEGLERLGGASGRRVIHGTTVALNALLTGSVARTALVTNAGFRDLIEIGRQDRPELYALHPVKPLALVPRELRFEVDSRAWPDARGGGRGLVHVARPSDAALARLAREVRAARPESIAVCLLHAYAEPELEQRVARALRSLGVPVTTSSQLLREHREYERFSTAVVNAALVPVMRAYLELLARGLSGAKLELLQSSGGTLPAERAAIEPVRVLLSGPAGGVVGAARAAAECGFERMVSLDMGGTSADVAFHEIGAHAAGDEVLARESAVRVAGHPIAMPALDIHTIGCGGGSLVQVDAGGVLHVGPESAGADPGPVCYGRSDRLTTTDAHLLLGHIGEGPFLAGRLALDEDAVRRAFEKLARRLGTTPVAAAHGVLDVARAAMRRALAVMTMERGVDPAGVPLVAFGGAGGLHAAALAQSLDLPAAVVPRYPGALSALGLATARAQVERAHSVLAPLARVSFAQRSKLFAALTREAHTQLAESGVRARDVAIEGVLDLRYQGQSFEIRVPESARAAAEFERRHEHFYGYRLPGREIELVALRLSAHSPSPPSRTRAYRARRIARDAVMGERIVCVSAGRRDALKCPRIDREQLEPGQRFSGPALVEEFSGTTFVPPGWSARVAHGSHLVLERD